MVSLSMNFGIQVYRGKTVLYGCRQCGNAAKFILLDRVLK